MKLKPFLRMLLNGNALSFLLLTGPMNSFFRMSFLSTLMEEGIHWKLAEGPVPLEELAASFGGPANREALESFLQIGVRLKELKAGPKGYSIRGRLLKKLLKPENDALAALVSEVVLLSHETITKSPSLLREGRQFDFPKVYGELIARSSRVLEELLLSVLEDVVPPRGGFRLLEVGCGSGIYIKKACLRNPDLTAVGLEMQEEVAKFAEDNLSAWGLGDRVEIRNTDVREFRAEEAFDLVTLHNNIYYFPVGSRTELAAQLKTLLKPGGCLTLTTGCRNGSPLMEYLNLHCVMTEGMDALPDPEQFEGQLKDAGFHPVQSKRLIPRKMDSFYAFFARKPAG